MFLEALAGAYPRHVQDGGPSGNKGMARREGKGIHGNEAKDTDPS